MPTRLADVWGRARLWWRWNSDGGRQDTKPAATSPVVFLSSSNEKDRREPGPRARKVRSPGKIAYLRYADIRDVEENRRGRTPQSGPRSPATTADATHGSAPSIQSLGPSCRSPCRPGSPPSGTQRPGLNGLASDSLTVYDLYYVFLD